MRVGCSFHLYKIPGGFSTSAPALGSGRWKWVCTPSIFLLMTCSVRHLLYSTPNRVFINQNEPLLMIFISCSIRLPTNRDHRNRPFTRSADRSARKRSFPRRRLHRRRLVVGSWPFWLHPHLPSHRVPALVQSPAPQGHEASQTG